MAADAFSSIDVFKCPLVGLKDQVKQLGYIRETVETLVDQATLQDGIYKDAKDWLNSVKEFTERVAKSIIDDEDESKTACCKGLCPKSWSRYKISKRAANAAKDAVNLMAEGNLIMSNVSYRPDSRMKLFQDVMEAVKEDKPNIIGIYGKGGVGKTTLVKQVAKQVIEDKLFDKVIMAEVTQTPDHHKIQDKLAFDLGMEFDLNESMFHRADQLCKRLKKEKRVLIILDNIWTKLELDEVGIPSMDVEKQGTNDQRRCTMILTSRNPDLLCTMNSQKNFWIDALSKKEALQLFEKIVGDSSKTSAFQPMADEIVRRCGGLPIAVSTVANALKNKRLAIWNNALNQLRSSNPREIDGMDKNVYSSIKLSYDLLARKEAQSLFRLCGLYSEGHAIQVASLLRYGVGWGLFENVYTLEEARSRVYWLIDNLKSSCLLLDSDARDEVKMHDVIHVVAVSIATEELMFNIQNVADLDKKMEETISKGPIAISLPHRDIQELPERLQCPNLQLFLLFTKAYGHLQISDHIFEGTEGLRVLDFTGIHFSSLPSSLGRLINLQTLCLHWCQLEDVATVGQLKKLEILSFRDSNIEELPLEIGQLTRIRLLDLSNCRRLKVIAPNVISKLSQIEELYMGNSFSEWDKVQGRSNASLVELKGLSKLTTLEIHVRDAEILPQNLVFMDLERYRICIGEVCGHWSVKSETSRLMELRGLENVSILLENYGTKMLLKKTEYLYLEKLEGVQNVVHQLDDGEGFPRLKHLQVKDCSEILHIGQVGRDRCKAFRLLESLSLIGLINLETICYSQLAEDQSFSKLRIVEVKFCKKLKHLFSFSMAKNILRLQKVEVTDCYKLRMIVGTDMEKPTTSGFKEIMAEDGPVPKVIFPSLEELKLAKLRNIEKLWPDEFQKMDCCQNLTKVTVESCHRLKYLFSHSMANSLVHLQHLEIYDCESMQEVVRGLERDEGKLIELNGFPELKGFPKLDYLGLSNLPNLRSFANIGHIRSHSAVEFPSLLKLEIEDCHNLKRFISMSSSEDNNDTKMQPQPRFDEKVRLPRLQFLHVKNMARPACFVISQ